MNWRYPWGVRVPVVRVPVVITAPSNGIVFTIYWYLSKVDAITGHDARVRYYALSSPQALRTQDWWNPTGYPFIGAHLFARATRPPLW